MTMISYEIPDYLVTPVTEYVVKVGGRQLPSKSLLKLKNEDDENDEVTHERFFGENLKRLFQAFQK